MTKEIEEQEDNVSPYCAKCDGCGHDGCCSWLNCFRSHISDDNCDYGETYIKDAILSQRVSELAHAIMTMIQLGKLKLEEINPYFDQKWNEIYDEIHKKK